MLNFFDKYIVYLDTETLKYMFMNYTGERKYPVMTKLFNLLKDAYINNQAVTPISYEHVQPFISDKKIDIDFLNMIGEIGQIKFHQRFTIRTLQLIRVINSFFLQSYRKELWKDAFSNDPDEKYKPVFNVYHSFSAQTISTGLEREKKNSMIYYFIKSFRDGKSIEEIAGQYYYRLWEQFSDLITPFFPADGSPGVHINNFIKNEDIKDIPEFHLISNLLYPIFETFGIENIEKGANDELLVASEKVAAYMPYCHFYVTTVDVAELIIMSGINSQYNTTVYDNNESSLYKLISDLTNAIKTRKIDINSKNTQSIYKKNI